MRWVTAAQLENWARGIPARDELPKIVSELIRASLPDVASMRFPSGDKGQVRGFDGHLESDVSAFNVPHGPYWAVSKYKDIMQVEVNHQVYSSSSELGGIQIEDQPKDMDRPSFIRMDPPKHDDQRKVVSPVVAPGNLANMEGLIRERTIKVLEGLPRGEIFDWVDKVSIELTTMMLATLFDYPWADRRQLTYWSDVAIANVNSPEAPVHSEEERFSKPTLAGILGNGPEAPKPAIVEIVVGRSHLAGCHCRSIRRAALTNEPRDQALILRLQQLAHSLLTRVMRSARELLHESSDILIGF